MVGNMGEGSENKIEVEMNAAYKKSHFYITLFIIIGVITLFLTTFTSGFIDSIDPWPLPEDSDTTPNIQPRYVLPLWVITVLIYRAYSNADAEYKRLNSQILNGKGEVIDELIEEGKKAKDFEGNINEVSIQDDFQYAQFHLVLTEIIAVIAFLLVAYLLLDTDKIHVISILVLLFLMVSGSYTYFRFYRINSHCQDSKIESFDDDG